MLLADHHVGQLSLSLRMMKAVMSLVLILITGISSVNPDQRVTGLRDIDDYHVSMINDYLRCHLDCLQSLE